MEQDFLKLSSQSKVFQFSSFGPLKGTILLIPEMPSNHLYCCPNEKYLASFSITMVIFIPNFPVFVAELNFLNSAFLPFSQCIPDKKPASHTQATTDFNVALP